MTDPQVVKRASNAGEAHQLLRATQKASDLAGQVGDFELPEGDISALDPAFIEKVCLSIIRESIDAEAAAEDDEEPLPSLLEALEKAGCPVEVWHQVCQHPAFMETYERLMHSMIVLPRMPSMLLAQTRKAQMGGDRSFSNVKAFMGADDSELASSMALYSAAGEEALRREAASVAAELVRVSTDLEKVDADAELLAKERTEMLKKDGEGNSGGRVDHQGAYKSLEDIMDDV